MSVDDLEAALTGSRMLGLTASSAKRPLRVLCFGAHSDDLEIGCAGTLLEWSKAARGLSVTWAVLSAHDQRGVEAQRSVMQLLGRAADVSVRLANFRDGHFPAVFSEIKDWIGECAGAIKPDVVLTHRLEDRHQDHRLIAEVTWQTFRDHLILEYEIPKYEGDHGSPNVFVPLRAVTAQRKVKHLMRSFGSQRSRHWFDESTFFGLMRLRGLECRAPSGMAEAFHVRKSVLRM